MRSIGMDVHRSFAQVAIHEDGLTAKSFRVELEHDAVVAFGKSLRPDDEVVLEATGNTVAIVRLLTPFVARVLIANPMQVKAIAHARVKTDEVDAAILAQLHAAGFLPEVWSADDDTLALRRLVSERVAVVRSIRRAKSRAHAVLHANLIPKYEGYLFGKGGRQWLANADRAFRRTRGDSEPVLRQLKMNEFSPTGIENRPPFSGVRVPQKNFIFCSNRDSRPIGRKRKPVLLAVHVLDCEFDTRARRRFAQSRACVRFAR